MTSAGVQIVIIGIIAKSKVVSQSKFPFHLTSSQDSLLAIPQFMLKKKKSLINKCVCLTEDADVTVELTLK